MYTGTDTLAGEAQKEGKERRGGGRRERSPGIPRSARQTIHTEMFTKGSASGHSPKYEWKPRRNTDHIVEDVHAGCTYISEGAQGGGRSRSLSLRDDRILLGSVPACRDSPSRPPKESTRGGSV